MPHASLFRSCFTQFAIFSLFWIEGIQSSIKHKRFLSCSYAEMRRAAKFFARFVNVLEKMENMTLAAVDNERLKHEFQLLQQTESVQCDVPMVVNDHNVSSLSQFFDEVRRLRKSIGASTSRDRNLMREELLQFWESNIIGASSNARNARDVGFICSFALIDARLNIPALCLSTMFQLLVRDKRVVTAIDATVSYHVLSREARRVLNDNNVTSEDRRCISTDFVAMLEESGVEMLHKFFRSERNHVGRGDDALNGLEFIINLAPVKPESAKLAEKLFRVVCEDDLKMTSLSQAFGLLRAFSKRLPQLACAEIAVALLRQVRRHDERFVNGFHFLKIVNCISRIPPPFLQNEKMWVYLISKACIFVPNMAWKHKEVVVISLRIALCRRNMDALLKPLVDEIKSTVSSQDFEALVLKPLDPKWLSLKQLHGEGAATADQQQSP